VSPRNEESKNDEPQRGDRLRLQRELQPYLNAPSPPKSCCSTSGKTNYEGTKGTKVFTKKTSQVRVLFAMAVPESSRSARNAQEFSDRKDRLGDFFVLFVSSCYFRANQPYRFGFAVRDVADDGGADG
jgi:hypothetical protein